MNRGTGQRSVDTFRLVLFLTSHHFFYPSLLSILGERLAYFTRLGERFSQCGCSKPRGDSRQALPVLRWVWAITVHMETPLRQAGRIDRAGFPSLKDHLRADTNPMMQELRLPYRRSEAREAERRQLCCLSASFYAPPPHCPALFLHSSLTPLKAIFNWFCLKQIWANY